MPKLPNEYRPYRVEYATSNRSKCKRCKVGIEKDRLRLAVVIIKEPHWYHYKCFFKEQRPKTFEDIGHFESIRWKHQEKIKNKLESLGLVEPVYKRPERRVNFDCTVEYAISGRSVCGGCQETIVKWDIRIGKMEYESEEARRFGGINKWYHLECFVTLRKDLGFLDPFSSLSDFDDLQDKDKQNIEKLLPSLRVSRSEKLDAIIDSVISGVTDVTDGPSSC